MIFDLLITPANAQAAGGIAGFDFMSLLPLVLIFGVFYLFLIRPQQKKAQNQKSMLSALRRGDRVLTSGGIIGSITKIINDQELQVEIAEGVKIRLARSMVVDVLSKTEPAGADLEESKPARKKAPTKKKVAAKKK